MNRKDVRAKANLELISEAKLLFLVEKLGESGGQVLCSLVPGF